MNLDILFNDKNKTPFKSVYNIAGFTLENNSLIFNYFKFIQDEEIKLNIFDMYPHVYTNIIGSTSKMIFTIIEQSDDNTELKIKLKKSDEVTNTVFNSLDTILAKNYTSKINSYLYFSDFTYIRIANWIKDDITSNDTIYLLKLETPLISTTFSIISNLKTATQSVKQIRTNETRNVSILNTPNFNIPTSNLIRRNTDYNNYESIVGATKEIQSLITSQYLNFYEGAVSLNVDYSDYSNFVHFSSAESRLLNFKYKLELIQQIQYKISQIEFQVFIDKYNDSINEIIHSFDGYEYYLYYDPNSYPKDVNNIPISLTDNVALLWLHDQLNIAHAFDIQNIHKLTKTVPIHILNGDSGHFTTFIKLIGQHFDIVWLYTNHFKYLKAPDENLTVGLDKDLVYSMLKSFGWNPAHDLKYLDLWEYRLGSNTYNEDYINIVVDPTFKKENVIKETWKRILNNLPFLYKHKGTAEGIQALINCYGIPRTELQILEYSGVNNLDVKSLLKLEKFAYAIDLSVGHFNFNWVSHKSIEFRFKLLGNDDYTLLNKNGIQLKTEHTDGDLGVFILSINGTDYINQSAYIYNNDWWSVCLTNDDGDYTLFLKQRFQDMIVQSHIFEFTPDSSDDLDYLSSNTCSVGNFNGYIQEFRLWTEPLLEESFNEHVLAPTMYSGNTLKSAYNNLIFRLPLGTDTLSFNHSTTLQLQSKQPNQSTIIYVDFVSFPNEINYVPQTETYYYTWVDMSGNRSVSNKVRIDTSVNQAVDLSVNSRADVTSTNTPVDINKIGVFLSPSFEVNKDISQFIGGKSLDDLIGTYDLNNSNVYRGLEAIRRFYMKQYNGRCRTTEYLKLINYFSNGLFKQIENMIPARANLISELVIESNLLYRTKMPINRTKTAPIINQYSGEINADVEQVYLSGTENSYQINLIGFVNLPSLYELTELRFDTNGVPYYVYKNIQSYIPTYHQYPKSEKLQIKTSTGYISGDVRDSLHVGMRNSRYNGCKISANELNQPSDGLNNLPVIEIIRNDDKNIIV